MEITIPKFVTYILAWSGTISAIWYLFDRAETVLNKEVLSKLSKWLKNDKSFNSKFWPSIFISIFDKVFGNKHLTINCFSRSMIASIFSITIVIVILYSMGSDFYDINEWSNDTITYRIFAILYTTILYSFFADYISLLQTRMILKWMVNNSIAIKTLFVFIDILLTTVIIIFFHVIGGYLYMYIFWAFYGIDESLIPNFWDAIQKNAESTLRILQFSYSKENIPSIAPWIYSTFLTSVWLWLFLVGSSLIKLLNRLTKGFYKFSTFVDIKNKPLRSLGFMCMILVTLIFILFPFI